MEFKQFRKRMNSEQVKKQALHIKKYILQRIPRRTTSRKDVLFIVGCQRSGTTMLQHILDQDVDTKVYGEKNKEVNDTQDFHQLRLKPLQEVRKIIAREKASFVVVKPLVESQRCIELLEHFPGGKALWIYRDFRDVAASKLKKSGLDNGIGDLRYIANKTKGDWRFENLSIDAATEVSKYFNEGMNQFDAAALFWYARNSLFFSLLLTERKDVMLLKYEELASKPEAIVPKIYRFAERKFPGEQLLNDVHSESVGKGGKVKLSPEIELLCSEMLEKLDRLYFKL